MHNETQEKRGFYATAERICNHRTSEEKFVNNAVLDLSGSCFFSFRDIDTLGLSNIYI